MSDDVKWAVHRIPMSRELFDELRDYGTTAIGELTAAMAYSFQRQALRSEMIAAGTFAGDFGPGRVEQREVERPLRVRANIRRNVRRAIGDRRPGVYRKASA